MNIHIHVSPRRVMVILAVVMAIVLSLSVIITFYNALVPDPGPFALSLFAILQVDREASVPAWFSASALLLAAVLLFFISHHKRKQRDTYRFHWTLLSVVFLYLSIDEAAQLHETLLTPVGMIMEGRSEGGAAFPWVLPALLFAGVLALLSINFLRSLPRRTAVLLIVAGGIYIMGAAGFELLTGVFNSTFAQNPAFGRALSHIEETMEMVGILIVIYTLMQYIEATIPVLEFTLQSRGESTSQRRSSQAQPGRVEGGDPSVAES